ncbi:MAG: hypothetical protein AAF566_08015 [Pseudomonadota bacterium]
MPPWTISGAQSHDGKAFGTVLDWAAPPTANVADKAYGSANIRQAIVDEGAPAVIPSTSHAKAPIPHDPKLCHMRTLAERLFCKMNAMRQITPRSEAPKRNVLSMLHLFATSHLNGG